jgi:hypothetical protein
MSANSSSSEMIAVLMGVLEGIENAGDDQPPDSAIQKPDGSEEVERKSARTTEDRGVNPLVERIAAAISILRNRAPASLIG